MLKTPRKKRIDSALKDIQNRKHSFLRFESMKEVLILFDYENWAEIKEIVEDLENNGKRTILWTVKPKKSKGTHSQSEIPASAQIRVIEGKDLSWYNGISSNVEDEFKALSYDTLIDLTTYTSKSLFYLLACNTARFCLGIREVDHKIYDFIVLKEDSKSLLDTYNQIKFYLNNIHKDK